MFYGLKAIPVTSIHIYALTKLRMIIIKKLDVLHRVCLSQGVPYLLPAAYNPIKFPPTTGCDP